MYASVTCLFVEKDVARSLWLSGNILLSKKAHEKRVLLMVYIFLLYMRAVKSCKSLQSVYFYFFYFLYKLFREYWNDFGPWKLDLLQVLKDNVL